MAIGATASDILSLVFKQGMLYVGVGLGIGLAASLAVNRILKSELVQVSPSDPLTLYHCVHRADPGGDGRVPDSCAAGDER